MWHRLICAWFLCITSFYIVEAIGWDAESSVILKNLGLNPSVSPDVQGSVFIDEDFGLESVDLIEGDIIPDEEEQDRSSVAKKKKLWPKGRIAYVISPELNFLKSYLNNAMKYIQNVTCLQFVQRTVEPNYIRIFQGKGCYSSVGMIGGVQNLSLGYGCYKMGKIMHELLHAAGFYHEQSRLDRDNYIYIHWENILKGHEKNFVKRKPKQQRLLTPYDYESIMHYSSYHFSKGKSRGLRTMTPKKEGVVLKSPGVKVLSPTDIKKVSILYNCAVPQSNSVSRTYSLSRPKRPLLYFLIRSYPYFG